MDHTQDQTDQPKVVPNNQGALSPVVPSVGGTFKEAEPSSQNLINSSEQRPEISAELAEIGLREISQTPQLTQADMEVGIRVSDRPVEPVISSTPVSFKSPLTQAEMVSAKKSRISDAIAWLAGTVLRQIKRSKFNERKSLPKPI